MLIPKLEMNPSLTFTFSGTKDDLSGRAKINATPADLSKIRAGGYKYKHRNGRLYDILNLDDSETLMRR